MTDEPTEQPLEAIPATPGENLGGDITISIPESAVSASDATVPVSIATDKLTEEHIATFWKIAKTDLSEALRWLNKKLSKI